MAAGLLLLKCKESGVVRISLVTKGAESQQSGSAAVGLRLCCLKKEISEYRKWVGRNYPFKLLPLWDFREAIMASDKLFGTEPSKKIKDSFPSSCLPINLPLFRLASSGGFVLICSVWNCRVTHKVITTSFQKIFFYHFWRALSTSHESAALPNK